jgi:hypothetical protein
VLLATQKCFFQVASGGARTYIRLSMIHYTMAIFVSSFTHIYSDLGT